jgi:cysteine desulfurase
MTGATIYADYAATALLRPAARRALLEALDRVGGNPSSSHRTGAAARALLEAARGAVASAIGARPGEIVFTSGATEANNLALAGAIAACGREAHLAVLATDHASVLAPARALAAGGHVLVELPVDANGRVDPRMLANGPALDLVSLALVNAETGVVQDVAALAETARARGAVIHVDAAQAATTIALDVAALGADLLTLSGHKAGGPPGVGALWVRDGLAIDPVQRGGAQESGLRAGTENVPAIAGFAAAFAESVADRDREASRLRPLTAALREGFARLRSDVRIAGAAAPVTAPHIVNATFPGIGAEALVSALDLDGVAAATGSACAAGAAEPSHVLQAMGWRRDQAACAVRFSFGWASTEHDVAGILARLGVILGRLDLGGREAAWPVAS